jgi:NDP-sugar pyrophosphorylase family protein
VQPFLLATGENRTLAPLTDELPPAMVPVGHQPVMAHVVELLAAQGFRRLVVSLHYLPASIEGYFGRGQRWGVSLEYVVQRDALGTAGALRRAGRLLNATILVMPADRLAHVDVVAALNHHRQHGYAATILVPAPSFEGPVKYPNGSHEADGTRTSIPPAEVPDRLGLYLLEPSVLELIPPGVPFDIHSQLIPALLRAGAPVGVFSVAGYWNPLASFDDYLAAQQVFMNRLEDKARSPKVNAFPNGASVRGQSVQPGIWVGRNNAIHPTARLAAPLYIGANCRIGRDVELGHGVVLGTNVIIDDEATVRQSVVLDNTYVGRLVKLEQRIAYKNLLIDPSSGESIRVADAFWLGETHTSLDQSVARGMWDRLLAFLLGVSVLPLAGAWAIALWLACGRAFSRKTYLRPAKTAGSGQPPSGPQTFMVLNFHSTQSNRLAAWLSRWQARLEFERLPELISVVAGNLRLVGVKPLPLEDGGRATGAWQLTQPECEPGFTGLWYLQTERDSDLDTVVVVDMYYAATRHLRGDLKILCLTPGAWLRRLRRPACVERQRL